jgi:hydrogenase-4 transcriptional activator
MVQSLFVRPLTDEESRQLTAQAQSANTEEARRANLLLLSAQRRTCIHIATELGFHHSNVKKWIRKFNEEGLAGVGVRKRGPREGPRPSFSRDQVEKLLQLASSPPAELGLGFKRWTAQKLAITAAELGIVEKISHVTVQQILKRNPAGNGSGQGAPQSATGAGASKPAESEAQGLALGRKALADSQFRQAAEILQAALDPEVSPGLYRPPLNIEQEAEIRSLLSQALEELGRYEESHSVVERYEEPRVYSVLPPSSKAGVKLRLGWAHSWLRNHPKAIAALNDAKKLFLDLQDERGLCEARLALGRTYVGLNEFRIARDHLMEAVAFQGLSDHRELMARVHIQLGNVDFHEGAFKKSKQNYLKALELVEGCANLNLLGLVFVNLGISSDDDDPAEREESANYTRRGIACLGESGHKGYLALAYNNLGEMLRFSGHWAEALESLTKAIEIALRYDQPIHEATGRQTIADVLCAMGRYGDAEEHLNRCIELAEKDSDKWLESYAMRVLAAIHLGRGQVDGALADLRQALRLSTSWGDIHGIILAEVALAEAHLKQGGFEQAREYVEMAQGRYKEDKSRSLFASGMLQRVAGEIETACAHFAEAKQLLAQSLSIFTTTAVPYEAAKTHFDMGLLLAAAGDLTGAESHLAQARGTFEALGALPGAELASTALRELGDGALKQWAPAKGLRDRPSVTGGGFDLGHGDRFPTRPSQDLEIDGGGGPTNDVLLMQRLIEASASRDLLLQELASVIYQSFAVDIAMVCQKGESGQADPIASEGLTIAEARHLCAEIDPAFLEYGGSRQGAYLAHLDYGRGNGISYRGGIRRLFVYVSASSGFDPERLRPLIKQAELGLETCSLRAAAASVSPRSGIEMRTRVVMPGFIIGSPLMLDVIEKIHKIRTSDVTVLITGESGTGKELVAHAIHAESARASAVFLPFNCTATPRDLIDSQLFGHRRGAFTGAIGNYPGMIRAAEGGTLFLDEIGDLALEVQPKLMRFLQEGEVQPLGETKPVRVDVRVLAATNSDLERAVDEGQFREDLFHRLNIIRIHVPPLRERREEIPVLASFFLEHFASRSGNAGVAFTQDAIDALMEYDWPGNVRQLRNEVERVTAYASEGALVSSDDLSPEVSGAGSRAAAFRGSRPGGGGQTRYNQHPVRHALGAKNGDSTGRPEPARREQPDEASSPRLRDAVAVLETRLISQCLAKNKNNLSRSAEELGLSRRGLRLKLIQLGIDRQQAE